MPDLWGVNQRDLALSSQGLPRRVILLGGAMGLGAVVIALLTVMLEKNSDLAVLLLDYSDHSQFPFPLTIQNIMHLMFVLGLGELFIRWRVAGFELGFLDQRYLPEDDESVLQGRDLGPIRQRVAGRFDGDNGFLPSLIDMAILQFQASRSVDQMVSVLNSSLELIAHRVDLRYAILRYLAWLIPTLGFIGTVVGIASALEAINTDDIVLQNVAGNLAVAFNTTIIALAESAILVLGIHLVQKQEEQSLNLAGNYCLRNLVNRMYAGD